MLFKGDLAHMIRDGNYLYIFVVVDVYSRRLFTAALEKKDTFTVKKTLQKFFKEAGYKPKHFETDAGTEFTGLRTFYQENKIFFKVLQQSSKAVFAEVIIKNNFLFS